MILTKLHVTQRGQAIVLARDAGLQPGPPEIATARSAGLTTDGTAPK